MRKIRMSWENKKVLCLYKGKSYINESINSWKVLGYHSTKTKPSGSAVLWLCECLKCGTRKPILPHNLFFGKSKSCFSCSMKNTNGRNNHNWKGIKNIPQSTIGRIKNQAKVRGLPFNLDGDFLNTLWENQNHKCALTGLTLDMGAKNRNDDAWSNNASLDRIDSSKGYLEENVQWVHPIVNMMKNRFNQDTFIQFCNLVVENEKRKANALLALVN